jgi:CBS domain-containing protein
VRGAGPITGEQIAERLNVTRAALRSDLAILVMSGIIDARPKVGYYYVGKNTFNILYEEIIRMKVRDIQSVPVVIPSSLIAYDAIVTMFLEDVGTIFVVEQGGILAGVLSRKDFLKIAMGGNNDLNKMPVKVIMTPVPKIVVTTPEEPVLVAAKKIIESEVDCLPVVKCLGSPEEKNYEVIGRLTKTNITRLFVELGEGKRR